MTHAKYDSGANSVPVADLLVVDDKPANLRLLTSMLMERGFKVRSAINGALALRAAQATLPDLILLDITMPGMSGYEVCEQLKADARTRGVPVIFISALGETMDKVRAFSIGGVDYITKPFQLEEVLARVETHLHLRRLQRRLEETNARLEKELALAASIQASFLPGQLPDLPGWQLSAALIPAGEMSGDFYDLIPLPGGCLGLVVADVSDKGTGAALFMALARTLLRTYADECETEPADTLEATHWRILSDTQTDEFVTVFYGILDPGTGTLTYANAGHNPPFLFSPDGDVEDVQELGNTGPPLGLSVFRNPVWGQRCVTLAPGQVLVLYSDGITDAHNPQETLFEERRLLETVATNVHAPASELQDALLDAVHRFMDGAPAQDDITLMILKRE
jgi:phosphoserine phosphatase RsbU/P